MQNTNHHNIAVFFTILFMVIISAPSIVKSFDNTIDITCFYGENEEEEKESLKLLFEFTSHNFETCYSNNTSNQDDEHTSKTYPKPHLNLFFPPPEFI